MNYKFSEQKKCDLVVIGGGGGGLVAAARAAWLSGKKVIVLEKAGSAGGAGMAARAIRTFGSKWQKERNLPDMTQKFILDAMDKTYWRLDHKLVANCFRATGEFFDWFCDVGDNVADKFEVGFYIFDGPQGPQVPLLKNGVTGKLFMDVMLDVCKKKGVEILTKHKVVDVEVENGKVAAVIAETANGHIRIACRACVLASGSWIRKEDIMKKIAPVFLEAGEPGFPGMNPASGHQNINYTGDGIALAEKAGAFVDYDSFCIRPMGPMSMSPSQVMNTMCTSPYAILVNLNGQRWVCEPPQTRMGFFDSGHVLMEQPKGVSYTVFDENTLAVAIAESRKPHQGYGGFFGFPKFPDTQDAVSSDIGKALQDARSAAYKADTIEELAKKMGVPAKALIETVNTYNTSCKAGVDWEFFKPAKDLVPLNKGPFYAVKGSLGTDGAFGGVLVNPEMQAYKKDRGLVEGLYVVGDFASGRHIVMAGVKVQVINDASWAYASGFIAGNSVCKYLEAL